MDPSLHQGLLILGAFLLVFLNGFFVAAEFSIVKVRTTRIDELIKRGAKRAKTARGIVKNLDEYLSATQLGITLTSLGLGWIGEPAFAELFEPLFEGTGFMEPILAHSLAASTAFAIITFLHIVLGELAPKSLAIQIPEKVVLGVSAPLHLFRQISSPFIWALNSTANALLRLIGIHPASEAESAHSEEELRMILAQSHATGILDLEERRMLERVFDFADRSARQIMVPAGDVIFLDTEKPTVENLRAAEEHGHTRYPLCEGDLSRVIGIIHVKDLLWRSKDIGPDFDLRTIRRPVHFFPESKLIKSILPEFRRTQTHLAVVVDEFGSSVGIVTLEDILEELVGEIQDEFDEGLPPAMIRREEDGRIVVHGRALLADLEPELGVSFDDEENDTIAGHVMMLLGRMAKTGDEVAVNGGFRIRVTGIRGLQITELSIERRI